MRSTILAALAAEAGDWRRHHYRDRGIVILPGITLQLGPRYLAPRYVTPRYVTPRFGHDRGAHWQRHDRYRDRGWHGGHRFDRHHHRGRRQPDDRGRHRRWHQ